MNCSVVFFFGGGRWLLYQVVKTIGLKDNILKICIHNLIVGLIPEV